MDLFTLFLQNINNKIMAQTAGIELYLFCVL
ncbi:Hypothetical protein SOFFGTOCOR_0065 [Candidatus Providencia siddallii]|uniref:Uncharacterized protein n=1 Tax=Candidatus Providencia siddallii TaxID=1715285 RepID=A0A0M6W999_9GAMM|nr:Hypothetical protein SOFFGTOCOR_0065 [Candidatus Providencia siddallii]